MTNGIMGRPKLGEQARYLRVTIRLNAAEVARIDAVRANTRPLMGSTQWCYAAVMAILEMAEKRGGRVHPLPRKE